jgi:hypothetical protein
MTRRARLAQAIAVLFTVANLVFSGVVLAQREWLHGAAHIALAFVGACLVWWLMARERRDSLQDEPADERRERLAHLEQIQQSVDAIAIEVERIGEGQRFTTKLQAERVQTPH